MRSEYASSGTVLFIAIILLIATLGNLLNDARHRSDINRNTVALAALYARVDSLEGIRRHAVAVATRNIWGDRAWGGDTLATTLHPHLVCVHDTLWLDERTGEERYLGVPPRWVMVTP